MYKDRDDIGLELLHSQRALIFWLGASSPSIRYSRTHTNHSSSSIHKEDRVLELYDESEGKVAKRNLDPTTLGDRDASGAGNSLKTLRPEIGRASCRERVSPYV